MHVYLSTKPAFTHLYINTYASIHSVYEVLHWHDPRLAYDLNEEGKCIFGSGRELIPSMIVLKSEYEGDYQRIWKPSIFMLTQRGDSQITNDYTTVDQNGFVTHVITPSIPLPFCVCVCVTYICVL